MLIWVFGVLFVDDDADDEDDADDTDALYGGDNCMSFTKLLWLSDSLVLYDSVVVLPVEFSSLFWIVTIDLYASLFGLVVNGECWCCCCCTAASMFIINIGL
jgi:hypothetical protein